MGKKRFSVAEVETFYTNMFSYFVKHRMVRDYYFPSKDDYTDSVIGVLTKEIFDTFNAEIDLEKEYGASEKNIGEYVAFRHLYSHVEFFVKDRDAFIKTFKPEGCLIGYGIYDFTTYDVLSDSIFYMECEGHFAERGLGLVDSWLDWKNLVILAELNGKPLPTDFKTER